MIELFTVSVFTLSYEDGVDKEHTYIATVLMSTR